MRLVSIGRFLLPVIVSVVGCGFGSNLPSEADLKKMSGGELKEVVPVSGTVTVDGSPAFGVNIYIRLPNENGRVKEARTDNKGHYCWTTYRNCDGLAPGEYKLMFKHLPKKGANDDLLNDRYSDAEKSEHVLTVEKGKPLKNANYDLTSK